VIVTFWKGVFCAKHSPGEERSLAKSGFELHEPTTCDQSTCPACRAGVGRRYWTSEVECAASVRSSCNQLALSRLTPHLKKLAESRSVDSQIAVPVPAGLSYRPFQRAGIAYAVRRKSTLMADQMGLGKSIEALGFVNYVKPKSALILCPNTLVLNWKAEAEKWLVDDYLLYLPETCSDVVPPTDRPVLVITNFEKVSGTSPKATPIDLSLVRRDSAIVDSFEQTLSAKLVDHRATLISSGKYDGSIVVVKKDGDAWYYLHTGLHDLEAARRLGWKKIPAVVLPGDRRWSRVLNLKSVRIDTPLSKSLRRKWGCLIVDEAHALKNPDTARSLAVLGPGGYHSLSSRSLFLTGTPMENYTREIWPLAAACCPSTFGSWWDFARKYCGLHSEQRGRKTVWVSDGSTHRSELQQKLRTTCMIRRLRDDVLPELPPKQRQLIVFPSDDVDWSKYPSLVKANQKFDESYDAASARLSAAKTQEEYLRAAKDLEKVTVGFTEMSEIRHQTALLKLPLCLKHADDVLASIGHLVIFAHHKDVLEQIHEHYGEDSCVMYGDTNAKDRMPMVREFQEGRRRVFIGGLRAAGVGITLTRAYVMSFFESDWNPATMYQAEDRLCRIGQKRSVLVYHPVLDHSVDANMVKKMLAKQAVVDSTLDRREDSKSR